MPTSGVGAPTSFIRGPVQPFQFERQTSDLALPFATGSFSSDFSDAFGDGPTLGLVVDYVSTIDWNAGLSVDQNGNLEPGSTALSDNGSVFDISLFTVSNSSIPTEWFSSLTADAIGASEWRAGLTTSTMTPADWRATTLIDVAAIPEWQVGLTVDVTGSVEWPLSFLTAGGAVVEWRGSTVFASVLSAEWRSATVTDAAPQAAWLGTAVSDALGTAESLLSTRTDDSAAIDVGASVALYGDFPADELEAQVAGVQIAAEWRSAQNVDAAAPVDWQAPLASYGIGSAEWRATSIADTAFLIAWGITILPADAISPIESASKRSVDFDTPITWRETWQLDVALSLETPTSTMNDTVVPNTTWGLTYQNGEIEVDWTGSIGVILDSSDSIEWRSGFLIDNVVLASSSSAVSRDYTVSDYRLTVRLRDDSVATNVEMTGQVDTVSLASWTTIAISDTSTVTSWVASTITDAVHSFAWGEDRSRDDRSVFDPGRITIGATSVPEEWSGSTATIANVTAVVEFRSGAFVDRVTPVDWVASTYADAANSIAWTTVFASFGTVVPTSWIRSVSTDLSNGTMWTSPAVVDAPVSIEYSGIADITVGDAAASVAFDAVRIADVTIEADWSFVFPPRFTKGATVEVRERQAGRVIAEGSGTKGAALEIPTVSDPKPIAEGSGTKGSALER